jgi:tetratricopeptide (TPR) repeat protein
MRLVVVSVRCLFVFTIALLAAEWSLAQTGKPAGPGPAPVGQAQKEFADLAQRAAEARDKDQLDEALNLYIEALHLKQDWAEGWWYLGTILYDRDRYAEARDALENLVRLQPRNASASALLGLCQYQTREYDRSLVNLQKARILGLGSNQELITVTRYHAAILMTRFEQFEVAFEILREFTRDQNEDQKIIEAFGINALRMPFLPIEVPPDKREPVLLAGRAAYDWSARRPEDARKGFQSLIARYPQTPNVHYIYGAFLLTDNPDAALDEFRKELEISPAHVPAMLQIAFEYIKRGDYAAARPFAENSVKLKPDLFPARNAYGRVLLETGDVTGAIRELEAGVKLAEDSPEMHFVLARAYAKAGRKEDAARQREAFTRLDKLMRTQREGAQSVGGVDAKPEEKKPQQK